MKVRVKICGITSLQDAKVVQGHGADAIGFILYKKSPRFIKPEKIRSITDKLTPFIAKVGVFVNTAADEINRIAAETGLTHIQLHGEETPEDAKRIKYPVIRALHENTNLSTEIETWKDYQLLIDSGNVTHRGGTGRTSNWNALKETILDKPFILAGGLNPGNIQEAIRVLRPAAVDVSSGVETAPGKKDHTLIQEFMEAVNDTFFE